VAGIKYSKSDVFLLKTPLYLFFNLIYNKVYFIVNGFFAKITVKRLVICVSV